MLTQVDHASGIFQAYEYDTPQEAQPGGCLQRCEHEGATVALQQFHKVLQAFFGQVVRPVL